METYGLFLFKSVLVLSVLCCFYWTVLRNEAHFAWNRLFLLATLLLSLIFPLFKLSFQQITTGTFVNLLGPVVINEYIIPSPEKIKSFEPLSILSIIYISGAVFFCLRFVSSIAQIHYLYFRFPKYRYKEFKAVVLDSNRSPFTFFNILFISRNDFEQGGIDEMIVHERAHKEAFHTLDVILLEMLTIIQWFNPFVWIFRRALKSEHEFIADHKVLNEGFDKVKYQQMLFEKSLGLTSFSLTHNFNYSLLKKRLKMMTTIKSNALTKIKYLLSMPVMLLTVMLIALNANAYGQKNKICSDVDVMAMYRGKDIQEIRTDVQKNLVYPRSAKDNEISAKIYVQFVVDEHGKVVDVEVVQTDILDKSGKNILVEDYKSGSTPDVDANSVADLKTEAVRAVKYLDDFTPAQKDGKNVKTQFTIPVNFVVG